MTWSDDEEFGSEDEVEPKEVANLCLMAHEDEDDICFQARSKKNHQYLDSGCSRHMMEDETQFTSLKSKDGGLVTFRDNSKGKIIEIGSINKNSSTSIENVLLVEGLKDNLLSISQLYDKGCNVVFESFKCEAITSTTTNQFLLDISKATSTFFI